MENERENSRLYDVLKEECSKKDISQKQLAKNVGRHQHNTWEAMRKGSTKYNDVIRICNATDLQLVIRNKETNTEYIMNPDDDKS